MFVASIIACPAIVLAQGPYGAPPPGPAGYAPPSGPRAAAPSPYNAQPPGAYGTPIPNAGPRPVTPLPQAPAGGTSQLVSGVRIVGNDTITADTITSYLRTRPNREYDPETLQADARRLAASGLFRGPPRIYSEETPNGVLVTFEVSERPTIRYINFHGNRGISDKSLLKQSGLSVGDSLNVYAVKEGRRKVEEFYQSKGFGKCKVSVLEGSDLQHRGVVYSIAEGPLQRIARVTFVGNTIATDGRLKTQIQSKPGYLGYLFKGRVNYSEIEADLDRLTAYYRSLGYFRARVGRVLDFDEDSKWLTIRFVIYEGPRYRVRNVAVLGSERYSSGALQSLLELQSGEFFNQTSMNKDLNTLREAYTGRGHIYADVTADPRFLLEQPGEMDLIYNVTEGERFRVGRINVHISGETPHTRESVVLDRLSVRPGDVVDLTEINDSERRLKASQLFLVDPASGKGPEIRIRPPDLDDAEMLSRQRGQTVRGQSPGRGQRHSPPPPRYPMSSGARR